MTRILTRDDVASLLTPDDCLHAVEDVFRAYGEGRVAPPQSLGVHVDGGTYHVKAAVADVFAAKVNANFPANPARHGLPLIQGVIVLMDAENGTLLAILDSTLVTALRTAAATAIAAKYLARDDASSLAIVGCGAQARAHVDALRRVRPITAIYACDIDTAAAARFAEETGADVVSLAEAVAQSDIVVTCTPSRAPILDVEHLHEGLFIAGVGADNPEKHEISPALLQRSIVVADILEQAATMGDLQHAIAAGVMTRNDVRGELADILTGRVPARRTREEIFVFDSTGNALQDVAVASIAYRRAVERGSGMEVTLH
jgi:alanine dehydrogenase